VGDHPGLPGEADRQSAFVYQWSSPMVAKKESHYIFKSLKLTPEGEIARVTGVAPSRSSLQMGCSAASLYSSRYKIEQLAMHVVPNYL
jgi:hypothetical protein